MIGKDDDPMDDLYKEYIVMMNDYDNSISTDCYNYVGSFKGLSRGPSEKKSGGDKND